MTPLEAEEVQALRESADRLDREGQTILARGLRNEAWCIEHGHSWLEEQRCLTQQTESSTVLPLR